VLVVTLIGAGARRPRIVA